MAETDADHRLGVEMEHDRVFSGEGERRIMVHLSRQPAMKGPTGELHHRLQRTSQQNFTHMGKHAAIYRMRSNERHGEDWHYPPATHAKMPTAKVPAVSTISSRMRRFRLESSSMLMYSSVSFMYSPTHQQPNHTCGPSTFFLRRKA
jgi:hypothetical protein